MKLVREPPHQKCSEDSSSFWGISVQKVPPLSADVSDIIRHSEGTKQTGGEYHRQECEEGGGAAAAVGAAELHWVEEQMGETRQGRMNSGQKEGESRA